LTKDDLLKAFVIAFGERRHARREGKTRTPEYLKIVKLLFLKYNSFNSNITVRGLSTLK
jgi:hypothetical protein